MARCCCCCCSFFGLFLRVSTALSLDQVRTHRNTFEWNTDVGRAGGFVDGSLEQEPAGFMRAGGNNGTRQSERRAISLCIYVVGVAAAADGSATIPLALAGCDVMVVCMNE